MEPRKPAGFMLINSKGYPDFVMTMLVVVILALILVIIFWMGLNLIAIINTNTAETNEHFSTLMKSFNENSQLIILGLCSSVFTLAGTYYLRRSSHDKNFTEREKIHIQNKVPGGIGVAANISSVVSGFVENVQSTLTHPNYDDEEEDI